MNKLLIIQSNNKEIIFAILQNKKLFEMYFYCNYLNLYLGDIYLGLIKNIDLNIKAAFINIGFIKDAFLHYHDLGVQFKYLLFFFSRKRFPFLSQIFFHLNNDKKNRVCKVTFKNVTKILVQLTKESISNKGSKLTTEISLTGKFLIIIPFIESIYISQRIKNCKKIIEFISFLKSIHPSGFGVIIPQRGLNRKKNILMRDLVYLTTRSSSLFKSIFNKIPPARVIKNKDISYSLLRHLHYISSIICDNKNLCKEISNYLLTFKSNTNKIFIIKHYNDCIIPVFEKYDIEKYMKIYIEKNIPLIYGAYLVIDHTEALHVIDVNTGIIEEISHNKKILDINLIAATEVARQLVLRDIGGIIIIDFIDMININHQQILYEHFKYAMQNDTAKYKILAPNKCCLIHLTREKVRHEYNFKDEKKNPNNFIYKKIESPIEHIYRIESYFQKETVLKKKYFLHIHPFMASYIKKGFPSLQQKWFLKLRKWIKIIPRYSFKYLEYQIVDEKNNIILDNKN